jgi:ubiquinone/menaquinone biosynthesis C-methylase UbiE
MSEDSYVRAWPQAEVTAKLYTTRWALAEFNRGQCSRILDIGCGDAYFESHQPDRFVGVDIDLARLQQSHGRGVDRLALASALHLPFGPDSFDGVLMKDVLEHFALPDAFRVVQEVTRVLKTRGTLIITTTKNTQAFWDKPDHMRPYSNKWVARVLVQELRQYEVRRAQELSGGIRGFGKLGLEKVTHVLADRLGFRSTHGIIAVRKTARQVSS